MQPLAVKSVSTPINSTDSLGTVINLTGRFLST